jgi:hypothetical protein
MFDAVMYKITYEQTRMAGKRINKVNRALTQFFRSKVQSQIA